MRSEGLPPLSALFSLIADFTILLGIVTPQGKVKGS
jgi:hypothetical protein